MQDITYTLAEVETVARQLLDLPGQPKLFLLTGDLGAGKTTLITAVCKQLDVMDQVSSPTYSIVNEYEVTGGGLVYHMDLYRLRDLEEALGIGLEEYLDADYYTFVEWPEIAEPLLPDDAIRIHIENVGDSARKIVFL